MNAKTWLSRAFCIEKQVQSKMEQIEALKSLACRMTVGFGSEPVKHTRNTSAMQDTVAHILEAEEELNRRIDELVSMKLEIANVIDRVEDAMLRLVLEKRYLNFETWEGIAAEMYISSRTVLRMHEKALEAVQEILDREVSGHDPELPS